jgi:ribosomal protein S18 acetylase RimI-like enzyme
MFTIKTATTSDISAIQEIAYKTWPDVYGEILSVAQLDYMLKAFYSKEVLEDSIINKGHYFILAFEGIVCLGFASFQHDYLEARTTRLHKIYLLPETQGKGLGQLLIAAVVNDAKIQHSKLVSLNVNRHNKAVNFYQKLGFEIIGEEDIEMEHGYLMEDYKLEKQLEL